MKQRAYYVKDVEIFDVSFDGFRNSVIHAVYVKPKQLSVPAPAVAMFHGYNWNNLTPSHAFKYTVQGIPVLIVDVRGQDIKSPDHNHYINGGALTLAAAALHPKVCLALSDIPYLCHFRRAIELFQGSPYEEISHYFKIHDQLHQTEEIVYKTLSYVDCMNLADRITCPTLISVGLEDTVCPPSTGFAAYNYIKSPKEIRIYPEYGHGGFTTHEEEKLKFAAEYILSK